MKKPTRQAISEGQHLDLHAGAAGKVNLAYSPEEMAATVPAKTGLPKRTAATITDKNRLLKELGNIRGASSIGRHETLPADGMDARGTMIGAGCGRSTIQQGETADDDRKKASA